MERLTVKRKDGRWAIANNDGASPIAQMEKIPLAINRLAAYEDTGLWPEEIETLLAEREAAVEDLRGRCDICKHRRVCLFDEQHRIGCANSKRGHWQWRGPTPTDR